jgi:hypothetical protein
MSNWDCRSGRPKPWASEEEQEREAKRTQNKPTQEYKYLNFDDDSESRSESDNHKQKTTKTEIDGRFSRLKFIDDDKPSIEPNKYKGNVSKDPEMHLEKTTPSPQSFPTPQKPRSNIQMMEDIRVNRKLRTHPILNLVENIRIPSARRS